MLCGRDDDPPANPNSFPPTLFFPLPPQATLLFFFSLALHASHHLRSSLNDALARVECTRALIQSLVLQRAARNSGQHGPSRFMPTLNARQRSLEQGRLRSYVLDSTSSERSSLLLGPSTKRPPNLQSTSGPVAPSLRQPSLLIVGPPSIRPLGPGCTTLPRSWQRRPQSPLFICELCLRRLAQEFCKARITGDLEPASRSEPLSGRSAGRHDDGVRKDGF